MEPWIDYDLPKSLIAQEPLENRADARLMVIRRESGTIEHRHVRDLPRLLEPGDRIVLNDTRVVPAQLRGRRESTGGNWQGLFLREHEDGGWRIVCKTRGQLKPPEPVVLTDADGRDAARLWLVERLDDGQWRAKAEGDQSTLDLLSRVGRVPLPPYIRDGAMVDDDVENYQTVFARYAGSVAAPTAGLHFTKRLLQDIALKGVAFSAVTLHVGLGTFRPIASEDASEHVMHEEWARVTPAAAAEMAATRSAGGRVVAVGTTVTRVLETVAAIHADRDYAEWEGQTDLYITPPYEYAAIDALMTNFHFPRTTLLLLVQAFAGSELVRTAYEEAIREEYRFYSYGDAMLIL